MDIGLKHRCDGLQGYSANDTQDSGSNALLDEELMVAKYSMELRLSIYPFADSTFCPQLGHTLQDRNNQFGLLSQNNLNFSGREFVRNA